MELAIARIEQQRSFPDELRRCKKGLRLPKCSPLFKLNPVYDPGPRLLWVGTRLSNAETDFDCKYPVLLPKKCHFSEALIWETHLSVGHQGVASVLNKLRKKWWLMAAKVAFANLIQNCLK